ncbi:hypothetical protein [Corynebacterium sp. TAE3-ERU16]|uniref:hypothetical protein n=1 Tax=Corynebacterium sp. TAE3-ERU16 TaxID=2849493 RepID=UPI001C46B581|nr:hypothetical protein [Corynebacterium sp. TAE3-ERU16]MBV7292350.1 hypothetical protein [Corynebacterium sp. TAE3-ERU16]
MSNDPAESVTVIKNPLWCWPIKCDTCGTPPTGDFYLQDWTNECTGGRLLTLFCTDCYHATEYVPGPPAEPADTRRALTQWAEGVISHAEAGDPTDPDEEAAADAYLARALTKGATP